MKFIVENDVKEIGVKVIGVVIKNINNKDITEDYLQFRETTIKELLDQFKDYDLNNDKIIQGFYDLHAKVGVPRRKNLPASENLIRLLIKNENMFSVNKVVDIYNLISMKSKLALGAHDMANIEGNVTLKITDGSELFIPLGSAEPKQVKAGEYSYVDDTNEIICRLEIRQVNKTKVTEQTKDVFYIIQGNEEVSEEYLNNIAHELINITIKYCGGSGYII